MRHAFTLVELLIVVAIIAVLSVVVILILNPAETLKQSRDSNRASDLSTLKTALAFYETQGGSSLGKASTTYVSIFDPVATSSVGDQCQGLSLPTLPASWSYHCAASSTYKNIDGTGWVPVNFSTAQLDPPIAQLPVDPVNSSSTGYYFTYTTTGGTYELTANLESQKYGQGGASDRVSTDGGQYANLYETGSNLALAPIDYASSSGSSIVFDASSSIASWINQATRTWSHTVGTGSNGILVVSIVTTNSLPLGVSYAGQSLVMAVSSSLATQNNISSIWYLVNPPSGTNTVSSTLGGIVSGDAGAVSFFNFAQTNPVDTTATGTTTSGSTGSASLSLSSAQDVIVDTITNTNNHAETPAANQTMIWTENGSTPSGASSYEFPTSTSATTSWTWSSSQAWEDTAAAFKPAQ